MSLLPSPDQEQEFLNTLREQLRHTEDIESQLEPLIEAAIDAKRPKFAGELFSMMPPLAYPPTKLQKAQLALQMMIISVAQEETEYTWADIVNQWNAMREFKAVQRLKNRHHPRNQYGVRAWRRR